MPQFKMSDVNYLIDTVILKASAFCFWIIFILEIF